MSRARFRFFGAGKGAVFSLGGVGGSNIQAIKPRLPQLLRFSRGIHALGDAVRHTVDVGEVSLPVLQEQSLPELLRQLAVRGVDPRTRRTVVCALRKECLSLVGGAAGSMRGIVAQWIDFQKAGGDARLRYQLEFRRSRRRDVKERVRHVARLP